MSETTVVMIAAIAALLVALVLLILYQRKVIREDTVSGVAEILQSLPVTMGSGLFGKIWEYSRAAVLAVEQMVKTGKVQPDDESRKNKALSLVRDAAKVDEVPFGINEQLVADQCIEANVQQLPRNQQKIAGTQDEEKTG